MNLKFFRSYPFLSILLVAILVLVIISFTSVGFEFSGWWPYQPMETYPIENGGFPSLNHPFGQTEIGNDYFAQNMKGIQLTIIISLIATFFSLIIGTFFGVLAASQNLFFNLISKISLECFMIVPGVITLLILSKTGVYNLWSIGFFISLVSWMGISRVVRTEVLKINHLTFLKYAKMVGQSKVKIIFKHYLPNLRNVIVIQMCLVFARSIDFLSLISFLGFGLKFPDITLGLLLNNSQKSFTYFPFLVFIPTFFICLLSIIFFYLSDILDNRALQSSKSFLSRNRNKVQRLFNYNNSTVINSSIDQRNILDLEKINLSYPSSKNNDKQKNKVLEDIRFNLTPNSTVAVVGESGSGKTQLARLITNLLPSDVISEGKIYYDFGNRKEVKKSTSEINSKIAYILQDPTTALDPLFTIEYQLKEVLENQGNKHREEYLDKILSALYDVNFNNPKVILTKYPYELSGGEQQRVIIAQALLLQPEVLICDEITSNLDVSNIKGVIELLKKLQQENHFSILFITHNILLAQSFCDKIVIMNQGKIVNQSI